MTGHLFPLSLAALMAVAFAVSIVWTATPTNAGVVFFVTSSADGFGDDGVCTLREAVRTTRDNVDVSTGDCGPPGSAVAVDIIELADGVNYNLTNAGNDPNLGDLNLGGGPLVIRKAFGPGTTTINGNFTDRVIQTGTDPVTISDITITNGNTTGFGGGIFSLAQLTLTNVKVIDNTTSSSNGGGVYQQGGTLTITNSTIRNNTVSAQPVGFGGGVSINGAGTHSITGSTIEGNSSLGVGNALFANIAGNVINVTNSTISQGATPTGRTLVSVQGGTTINFLNSTVKYDGSTNLFQAIGTITAKNTIFDNGQSGCASGIGAQVTTLGNNIDAGDNCDLDPSMGDQVDTDPQLQPLSSNGGTTQTHAILAGSPAVDNGANAGCPSTDQRGQPRPQGNACDVGAYESPFSATPAPTPSPTPSPTPQPTVVTATPPPTPDKTDVPTPSPSATETVTPSPTGTGATPTGGAPTPTATPTPTPGPTGTPGAKLLQGDVQCDNDVDSVDALQQLRDVASLETFQQDGCPEIGAAGAIFGDVDCDGDVDSVDALKVLRHVAALSVTQTEPCPDIGDPL